MRSEAVVRQAGPKEFERVGRLVYELLTDLYPNMGYKRSVCVDTARTLLTDGEAVWPFLVTTPDDRDVGVVTLIGPRLDLRLDGA